MSSCTSTTTAADTTGDGGSDMSASGDMAKVDLASGNVTAGTYPFTLTATSGPITASLALTLTVN